MKAARWLVVLCIPLVTAACDDGETVTTPTADTTSDGSTTVADVANDNGSTPDAGDGDAGPVSTPDVDASPGPDAASDVVADAEPDVEPDVVADATQDVVADVMPETTPDIAPDAPPQDVAPLTPEQQTCHSHCTYVASLDCPGIDATTYDTCYQGCVLLAAAPCPNTKPAYFDCLQNVEGLTCNPSGQGASVACGVPLGKLSVCASTVLLHCEAGCMAAESANCTVGWSSTEECMTQCGAMADGSCGEEWFNWLACSVGDGGQGFACDGSGALTAPGCDVQSDDLNQCVMQNPGG